MDNLKGVCVESVLPGVSCVSRCSPLPPAPRSPDVVAIGSLQQKSSSPGGRLMAPQNPKAKSTGPKKIQLSWDPPPGTPTGYKVRAADGPHPRLTTQNERMNVQIL